MYEPSRNAVPAPSAARGTAATPRGGRPHNSATPSAAPSAAPAPTEAPGAASVLAAHLTALLLTTEDLAALSDDPELPLATTALRARLAELGPAAAPAFPSPGAPRPRSVPELHVLAHDLAARVLLVAASHQDTRTALLACHRMEAHAAAVAAALPGPAAATA